VPIDNLTRDFLKELDERSSLTIAPTSPMAPTPGVQKTGESLWSSLAEGEEPEWLMTPEKKSGALHFAGAALWHFFDSALLGLPGLAMEDPPYEWDELGGGAKAGAVIGEAAGFLVPLKVIGAVTRLGVKGVKGTGAIVRKSLKSAGTVAEGAGVEAQMAKKTIRSTLRSPLIKLKIPAYAQSGKDIAKVEGLVRDGIRADLYAEFGTTASRSSLDDIANAVMDGLKAEGVHVNNIGHWVEKALNTTFNVADKSSITRYAGRWAEMGTSFAIYNLMTDGIQAQAGNTEFDPVGDVFDAFVFASLLPAVEMFGKGGQVKIIAESNQLRKILNKFDKKIIDNYDNMGKGELNGLLKILTKDNYLKDSILGKNALTALRKTGGKDLTKSDAIKELRNIVGKLDRGQIWKDFRAVAGKDLRQSLGRMMLGGFYFNSQTLLDYNMLRNIDPEILGAHLLVGMILTKTKKPLFKEPHPTLSGFAQRRLALQYFGLEAKSIENIAKSYDLSEHQGAAFSGARQNKVVKQIVNIIDTQENRTQTKNIPERPARIDQRDELVKHIFGVYDLNEVSGASQDSKDPSIGVRYENLTRAQLNKIKSEVMKIDIGEGVLLSEENFDSWHSKMLGDVLKETHAMHMLYVLRGANRLGVQTDWVEGDVIDIDKPIRVADIIDLESYTDVAEYKDIVKWQQIRNTLEIAGFIQPIKAYEPRRASEVDTSQGEKIKGSLDGMIRILKNENYGETSDVFIDPIDNGFLDALMVYKAGKILDSTYNIIEGPQTGVVLSDLEVKLRRSLITELGTKVPGSIDAIDISNPKDEKNNPVYDEKTWDAMEASGLIDVARNKLLNIIRMWGINKEEGALIDSGGRDVKTVDFDKAQGLVNAFESEGFMLSRQMTERVSRYFWNRFLKTSNIGVEQNVILGHLTAWGMAKFETKSNGKKVLLVADEATYRTALEDSGTMTTNQIEIHLEKYRKVTGKLKNIRGKFLEISNRMFLSEEVSDNMFAAVEDAYSATEAFEQDVLNFFLDGQADFRGHANFNLRAKSLLNSRVVVDEKGKRQLKQFDSREEAEQFVAELDDLVDSIKDNKTIPDGLLPLLKSLRTKVVSEESAIRDLGTEYESAAELLSETIKAGDEQNELLLSNVAALIYDMDNFTVDRMPARRRKERMIASFVKDLGSVNVEVAEDATLSEIAELYEQTPGKNISEVIRNIAFRLGAWRKGYEEESWVKTQMELSKRWEDLSSLNADPTPKFSASYISQEYGRYNSELKDSDWLSLQEGLREQRELQVGDEPSIENRAERERIINAVRSAIDVKNVDNRAAADEEFNSFMKNVFPAFLAHSVGTERVTSGALDFVGGKPIIELTDTVMGRGAVVDFINSMSGNNIFLIRLNQMGVYGGRKVDVRTVDTIDSVINSAQVILGEGKINQLNASLDVGVPPFQKVIRVITSTNNEFLVSMDNLTEVVRSTRLRPDGKPVLDREGNLIIDERGVLNEVFNTWFQTKRQQLVDTEDGGAQSVAVKKFDSLYKEHTTGVSATEEPVRQMIRAMYWNSISSTAFTNLVKVADNKAEMRNLGSDYFNRFSLAEATGAKTQGSSQFLREVRQHSEYLPLEVTESINYYLDKGNFEIVGVNDKSGKAFSAERLVKEQLKEQLKLHKVGTPSYDALVKAGKELTDMLPSLLNSSAVDAHTWLGTNAANVLYLHRGRYLGGETGNAGIKPSGWYNDPLGTIFLKTNFTFDPKVAELLDEIGIDILTTETAAKFFNVPFIDIKVSDVKGGKSAQGMLARSGKFGSMDADLNWVGSRDAITENITPIGLENIFIGKTEDRHGLTTVSYSQTDFLNEMGYKSFMTDYVGYSKRIDNALGSLKSLVSGSNKQAAADFLMRTLRAEGALFDDGTSGLVSALLEAGTDPESITTRNVLQRTSMRHITSSLRKPKTEGASFAIMIPYLEGTPSVYDGNRRIIHGGKKVSDTDGNLIIKNWNNVKYIMSFSTNKYGLRDLQLGRNTKGEWILDDPYGELDSSSKRVQSELKRLERIEKRLKDFKGEKDSPRYRHIFNKLEDSNRRRAADNRTKFYLNSLTLRIPSPGAVVAINRVEGFYDPLMGNVVGVNMIDLAATHQGDFDVDAAHSSFDAPGEFASSLSKMLGAPKDVYTYESDAATVDIFNNGFGLGTAGSGGESGDSMHNHVAQHLKGKENFGVMKRLSSGVSALERNKTLINGFGSKVEMLEMGSDKFNVWLQRYYNTLQTLVDAVKHPNFISIADSDSILKFVLFDRAFPGSDKVQANLAKYGESEFKSLFKIDAKVKGIDREVLEDVIIESMRALSRSQRFFGDVWDAQGRRAPDAIDIQNMRSDLYRFTEAPNQTLFNTLIGMYRGRGSKGAEQSTALIRLFYGDQKSYRDQKQLMKDINNRKFRPPKITKDVVFFGNKEEVRDTNPGNYIINRINQSKGALIGWSVRHNNKGRIAVKEVTQLLDDIETIGGLTNKDSYEEFLELLDVHAEKGLNARLAGKAITKIQDLNAIGNIQSYSTMFHILENQRNKLQSYISGNDKANTRSIARARRRLRSVRAVMEHFRSRESTIMSEILTADAETGKRHKFYYRDFDYRRENNARNRVYTNTEGGVHYIYKVVKGKDGITRYKRAGWANKGWKTWLEKGQYVVLTNPIRYDLLSDKDIQDGYALAKATGEITAETIATMPGMEEASMSTINNFMISAGELKSGIGVLAREVYKESEKGPHQTENWMWESRQEDKLMNQFMQRWMVQEVAPGAGAGAYEAVLSDVDSKQRVLDIVSYIMKPEIVHGQVVVVKSTGQLSDVAMPAFKINKRLVLATARWLRRNGQEEIFKGLFGNYGRFYRQAVDNIVPNEISDLHSSSLFHRGRSSPEKSPLFDLVYEKGWLYYPTLVPSMLHITRNEMKRLKDRTKVVRRASDENLEVLYRYGNMTDVRQMIELYERPDQFELKENKMDC